MTYDVMNGAPVRSEIVAEKLHEYAVNELGLDTYDVLFTARSDGFVVGEIIIE